LTEKFRRELKFCVKKRKGYPVVTLEKERETERLRPRGPWLRRKLEERK
jgi:hypothetical protein